MEFPRLVYRTEKEHKLIESQEEFDLARKDGWYASVPEAKAKEHADADSMTPTRAELEAKADELGIKFDGRTSDAKLLSMINEAIG